MSYNLAGLVAKFRADQDDLVDPQLWSDSEIYDYLDEAQEEICEEVDILSDNIEIPFVAATVAAADGELDVSSYRITRVRSVDLVSPRKYMVLANWEEFDSNPQRFVDDDYGLDAFNSDWKDQTNTYPRVVITDYDADNWRLYPIPTEDGTFKARVYHKPLTRMYAGGVEPVVTDRQLQQAMLLKARSLAYLKQDSETYDVQNSQKLEAVFLQRCAEYRKRTQRKRRRTNTTSYGGIAQSY